MSEAPSEVIRIGAPAAGGGVGRMQDGRVVFVRHSLPGELVRISVSEALSRYSRAEAIEIIESSRDRVTPPCPHYGPGKCGGCDLQHGTASAQRDWKAAVLNEQLLGIAGLDLAVEVESSGISDHGSRTRLRCAVDDQGRLSLRKARSHDLITLESCWVVSERLLVAFDRSWVGASEVELRDIGDGEPFAVVTRRSQRGSSFEIATLAAEPISGSVSSTVTHFEHNFQVHPISFWQSHRNAPGRLTDFVLDRAEVSSGDKVVDLYSGVGVIGISLSRIVGDSGKIDLIEASPTAANDARDNADGLGQVTVHQTEVTPRTVASTVDSTTVVILDPPRAGLAKGLPEALLRRNPRQILYISCDPSTFARDLKILLQGYQLDGIQAIDLFPMTEHVEVMASLTPRPRSRSV